MNATTHPFAPEEIMAFLDGELSRAESASLAAHLEGCMECGELAAKLREMSKSLVQWQVNAPKDSLEEHILQAVASGKSSEDALSALIPRLQSLFSRRLPWALACLALSVLIGARLFRSSGFSYIPSAKSKEFTALVAPPDSARQAEAQARARYELSNDLKGGGGTGGYSLTFGNSISDKSAQSDADRGEQPDEAKIYNQPMIARTVSLAVVTKEFETSRKSLDAILTHHNGYSAQLSVTTPQGAARSLQASLRIPAPQLTAAVAELKSLGRVETESQNGEEVTQQHADLVARLKNSRETEQRLQAILAQRTGKISDVLAVEQEIARVRGNIEQMEAEQKNLEHRVDFATIDLTLSEEYKAQLGAPAPSVSTLLHNALVNGLRTAADSFLSLVLFLSESVPVLLLWLAILALPVWQLWRRYRRAAAAI